jgi:c-di-GMP-binding flagellar brake protein YcgR
LGANPYMSDQTGPFIQRRQYFRIRYPAKLAPEIVIWARNFRVVDISEMGVRFTNPDKLEFPIGYVVRGVITFYDKESLQVSGSVAWANGDDVALRLVKGIPFSRVLSEQAFLRRAEQQE